MVRVLYTGGTCRERVLRGPGTGPAGTRPIYPARPSYPTAPAQVSMNVAFYRIDSVERHNH